jgi:hypothetical protein
MAPNAQRVLVLWRRLPNGLLLEDQTGPFTYQSMPATTMIGASMVEAMDPPASNRLNMRSDTFNEVPLVRHDRSLGSIEGDERSRDVQRLPLPSHPPSFIETVLMVEDSATKDVKHAFLHGPQESGMSSLLLELACSLASKTPCRCPPSRASRSAMRPSSPASPASSRALPCNGCTAVLIFRPAQHPNECDPFPIPCHGIGAKQERDDETLDCDGDTRPSAPSPELLRRIQIHHVGSARDMFRTLLQVQGWGKSQRPVGGILVDDFHRIVSESHPEATRGSVGPTTSTPNVLLGAKLRTSTIAGCSCRINPWFLLLTIVVCSSYLEHVGVVGTNSCAFGRHCSGLTTRTRNALASWRGR